MRRATVSGVLFVAVLTASCAHVHAPATQAIAARQYELVTLPFTAPEPVTVRFTGPAGRALQLSSFPTSDSEQRVRFTPPAPGTWKWEARGAASHKPLGSGRIEAAPSRDHGFIRTRGHHFVFSDGAPFIVLGENRINLYDRTWNYGQLSAEDYLRYMARNGMTTLRVFIVSDVEDEEHGGRLNPGVIEPKLGQFDQQVAEQFDRIFRAAEANGIYVVLVPFALGFSENDPWKSWEDNPYSAARGGPARTRYEFFEPGPARALAANRLRYLAARYASSTHLLAIDLLNEPEWDGAIPEVSWIPWAEEMAKVWRSVDPYGHLVTVGSVGLHWNIEGDERPWYASPENSFIEWHLYGKETYEVHALAAEMTRKVKETWGYDKPVLVGEFAYGGEAKPEYDHTHVGIWSAMFSGAGVLAHSAPPFNVDSDEFMTPERARHFRVLHRFLSELPMAQMDPVPAEATSGVKAWALCGGGAAAIWLLAPEEGYGRPLTEVKVSLPLPAGEWAVRWIDDVTGQPIASERVHVAQSGQAELTAPAFQKHVAASLRPEGDQPAAHNPFRRSRTRVTALP